MKPFCVVGVGTLQEMTASWIQVACVGGTSAVDEGQDAQAAPSLTTRTMGDSVSLDDQRDHAQP